MQLSKVGVLFQTSIESLSGLFIRLSFLNNADQGHKFILTFEDNKTFNVSFS